MILYKLDKAIQQAEQILETLRELQETFSSCGETYCGIVVEDSACRKESPTP